MCAHEHVYNARVYVYVHMRVKMCVCFRASVRRHMFVCTCLHAYYMLVCIGYEVCSVCYECIVCLECMYC